MRRLLSLHSVGGRWHRCYRPWNQKRCIHASVLALREIAQFHGLPENATEQLDKSLDDAEERVRTIAARAMSWIRPSSTKAVAILAKSRKGFVVSSGELLDDLERMGPHNEASV